MADVPRVFLDQVDQYTAQTGRFTPGGEPDQLVQPTSRQSLFDRRAGAGHGVVPQREELLGSVVGGRVSFPIAIGLPVHFVPRRSRLPPEQAHGEVVVLHEGKVLEQPAQGDRRGPHGSLQASLVEPSALPGKRRALAL